ncbi:DUF1515 domain-containing protein [Chelativorans salis]|uniref:DUF1515 domain-containing protein n=1 Tax=Chelativorans salis TaxID=2978478 RepID=A0ABT2LLK2_9HYPH|nr:DUF1515 domain-containing protein [Chelativorans sp. EGI FJ00035]MCT7375471.1 DUF1515 domain-containing protein [Chelativorans sp. EGI FJ00035]
MAQTSLNEIYKAVGELTNAVQGLQRQIEGNEKRNAESIRKADQSRANVHRRLDEVVMRTTHLESDMMSVKGKVESVQTVTDDIKQMRQQAVGAGTLGVWLWKIGGWVIGAAAGFMAAYTWLTGRPPP